MPLAIHPMAGARPYQLLKQLAARPWHDPSTLTTCRALAESYDRIRAEAMALLAADATGGAAFERYESKALATGEWADVGLYFNGMRNEANAPRAPLTSSLLCSDVGGLRCDATSLPLGSAYFSLLRSAARNHGDATCAALHEPGSPPTITDSLPTAGVLCPADRTRGSRRTVGQRTLGCAPTSAYSCHLPMPAAAPSRSVARLAGGPRAR